MSDFLIRFGISNLCISIALAAIAFAIHRIGRFPMIAHLVWLLVLVKLVTPAVLTVPIVPVPIRNDSAKALATERINVESTIASQGINAPAENVENAGRFLRPESNEATGSLSVITGAKWTFLMIWLPGSIWVLIGSVVRIQRFSRLLRDAMTPATPELERLAAELAEHLGLKTRPLICMTSARLSPMVWWIGGRVRIVIPGALLHDPDANHLRWILAHELAHVRRRDHLVRWLEWLACVIFWWNPIAWWARRNLRINEEICCDALVLNMLRPEPRAYANSLMHVVEFLASPVVRPPAVASRITSGGFLERRFEMILSSDRMRVTPRWLRAGVLALAVGLLPLGVAYAQDYDAVGRRLKEAVANGELSGEQARIMMGALKKAANRHEGDEQDMSRERYLRAEAELRNRVASGKISKEDAEKKLVAIRKAISREPEGATRNDNVERRIAGSLEVAGVKREVIPDVIGAIRKIVDEMQSERSAFEIDPDLIAYLKKLGLNREQTRLVVGLSERLADGLQSDESAAPGDRYKRRIAQIREKVERGDMSRKEAGRAIEEMRRTIAGRERDAKQLTKEEYIRIETELKKQVAAGKISAENARDRLITLRRSVAGRPEAAAKRLTREDYVAADKKLRQLVADGEISIDDAAKRLKAMRDRIAEQNQPAPVDWQAVRKRVEGAVERGDMTREEAQATYLKIKKQMAEQNR